MNVAELARRLHVSRAYVVALADRGDVSCTRDADGRRTFDDSAAEAYIAAAEERKARAFAKYLAASQAHKEDL